MTALTNCSAQLVAVDDAGERKEIAPGATVDVDGRQNWAGHLFVRAGWLRIEPPKQAAQQDDSADKSKRRKR